MKVTGKLHASAASSPEKVCPAPGWGPEPAGQFGQIRVDPRLVGGPARDLVTIPTALYQVRGSSKPLEL